MKTFSQLVKEINEAKYEWPASLTPGTKEYKERGSKDGDGSRHKIEKEPGIVRATRKYDSESGESEEPTKNRENAAEAPAKRGRGRPPGKYGSYKKKLKESLEILESLETQEEIEEFISSLDQESFEELEAHIDEELHPNQRVLDKNKNNKLDKEDFKMLRGEKKAKMEEVEVKEEQIDELSKKTLGNYVKAAAKDAEEAGRDQEYHGHKNDYERGKKRQKGIEKAVNRLTKEEHIDESVNRYAAFISTENK